MMKSELLLKKKIRKNINDEMLTLVKNIQFCYCIIKISFKHGGMQVMSN